MRRDAQLSLFVFPSMPAADRLLVIDLGELLATTHGRYRAHLTIELRLLREAADAEGCRSRAELCYCRVIPFRRLT